MKLVPRLVCIPDTSPTRPEVPPEYETTKSLLLRLFPGPDFSPIPLYFGSLR